jgi:hypothetical protein
VASVDAFMVVVVFTKVSLSPTTYVVFSGDPSSSSVLFTSNGWLLMVVVSGCCGAFNGDLIIIHRK